jgi:hypothetical protein
MFQNLVIRLPIRLRRPPKPTWPLKINTEMENRLRAVEYSQVHPFEIVLVVYSVEHSTAKYLEDELKTIYDLMLAGF